MANYLMFDIDGCINHEAWYKSDWSKAIDKDIDPKCIERLNKICSETGAYLVMSSDWRYDFKNACDRLYRAGLTGIIIGRTELSIFSPKELSRGKEIQNWVDYHLKFYDNYAIIDDRTDMIPGQPFFKIDESVGLTDENVENIINYFKNGQIDQ